MDNIAGQKNRLTWAVNLAVLFLVLVWTIPTIGLLISSFRDRDQIASSGWWTSLSASEQNEVFRARAPDEAVEEGGVWVISGNVFDEAGTSGGDVTAFGISSRDPGAFTPGDVAEDDGVRYSVDAEGNYRIEHAEQPEGRRGDRFFVTTVAPPVFTFENYDRVLFSEGIGQSFINTATVTIPATIIPILVAAFAAYALAWMDFPGRALLIAAIVGLLVVPLQLALIPLLKLHNEVGIGKSYMGIWLAHTAFGMPLAIYLLRNYIAGLPREIIESAKVDGATDFEIFTRIILPL